MVRLHYAPRTRSVRVRWLLEELGEPYELVRTEFRAGPGVFAQATPLGKFPVLEDDGVVFGESGAIVEYLLERYGRGRLAPPVGSPRRGPFLQWLHFAESTAYAPIGVVVMHTFYRGDADEVRAAVDSARERARGAMAALERQLETGPWVLGEDFSGADVMLGFTLAAAQLVGVLDDSFPRTMDYWGRLAVRPALLRASAD